LDTPLPFLALPMTRRGWSFAVSPSPLFALPQFAGAVGGSRLKEQVPCERWARGGRGWGRAVGH
jgi:hypothetical protein